MAGIVNSWRGAHAGAGLLAALSVPKGLHPVGGIHSGAVCEEVQAVGRTCVGAVCRGLSPVGDCTLEQGKSVRNPPTEERAAETTCDELPAAPIPRCCCRGGGREFGSEVDPGKKGGVEACVLRFITHYHPVI